MPETNLPDELDLERQQVERDHLCDCETCRRSTALCPASSGSIIDELAQQRIQVRKLESLLQRADDCICGATWSIGKRDPQAQRDLKETSDKIRAALKVSNARAALALAKGESKV